MILSKTGYIASINALLPDNSTQQISPEDIRNSFVNLADSVDTFLGLYPGTRTTRVGTLALDKLNLAGRTSVDNSAFGYYALSANYDGTTNTALGSHSLGCNLYGSHNVAVGHNAIAGNVEGSGNVGVGNFTLNTTKKGDFNIAIGHGAGHYIGDDSNYNLYVGAHPVSSTTDCENSSEALPPLLFGDLQNNKLGVGVKTLHGHGNVQVSGDIAPSTSGDFNLGNSAYPWASINEIIHYSGGKLGVGTSTPSGDQGLMTVQGHIVPQANDIYALGHPGLRWDGYFNDVVISGNAHINDAQYNTINDCLYDCKTLHLATSGVCDDGTEFGFHNSAVCGYLSDESLDGAGFEVHSSGSDYRRDYRFIYKYPDTTLTCLEVDDHYARSRWESNISIQIESGKHLQTDRVLGDSKLSLATESGCYGLFFRSHNPSGNRAFVAPEASISGNYNYVEDINFIGNSGTNILANGNPSGYDFIVSYGVIDSGVTVGQKFASRISQSMLGFGLEYHDDISNSADRFSTHVYNNQSGNLEAVTVLRNGGTIEQSGLFGITNLVYPSSSSPILPETIFNIQTSGGCDVRFSSSSGHLDDNDQWYSRTSLELLGNGNVRSSGLHISYNPSGDQELSGNPVIDFSLIRPSGTIGRELGFMTVSESGYVAVGSTKEDGYRPFDVHSPLTVYHSGGSLSGTVALKVQDGIPPNTTDFGKIYVKPSVRVGQSQSLFFLDDTGNEFELSKKDDDTTGGLLYGNTYGNTYGGYASPRTRSLDPYASHNTFLGHFAGHSATLHNDNTFVGSRAGSGLSVGNKNTVLGSLSFSHTVNGTGNLIIGAHNLTVSDTSLGVGGEVSSVILIGTGLYVNSQPNDYTLSVGFGETPLIKGSLGGSNGRKFTLQSLDPDPAIFEIDSDPHIFSIQNKHDGQRHYTVIDAKDKATAGNYLKISFTDSDNAAKTLLDLDPTGTMTNVPTFTEPSPVRPFMAVSGDLRLLGAVRFADGTSLDTASSYQVEGHRGIKKTQVDGTYYYGLDYTDLVADSTLTITSANTHVAIHDDNSNMGKMTLDSLATYVSSASASVGANCNMLLSNDKPSIDTANNKNSIFIGCNVATAATGWVNSVILGTEAGANATTPSNGFLTETAAVFIGYRAGHNADNVSKTIFVGTEAGKNATGAMGSIFIGSSAGNESSFKNSIGIGAFALTGDGTTETGENNIEIVAGKSDDQRLMYSYGSYSDRLNIQNIIAGDTKNYRLSIGDAVLSPDAPLSVRRDGKGDGKHEDTDYVQTWHNDDVLQSYVDGSGDYLVHEDGLAPAFFRHYEGVMIDYIYPAVSVSGKMRIKNQDQNDGGIVWVHHRDTNLDIHGDGATGGAAYVVTARVNGENRPIYISCSGT